MQNIQYAQISDFVNETIKFEVEISNFSPPKGCIYIGQTCP